MLFSNKDEYGQQVFDESEAMTFEQLEQVILSESLEDGTFANEGTLSEASYFTGQGSNKGSIIKFNKAAKMKQLQSKYAIGIGLAKNDPMAKKLKKINKTRKKLIAQLNKRYQAGAKQAAKEAIRTATKDSNAFSKYTKKAKGKTTSSRSASIKQQGNTRKTAQSSTK